MSVALPITSDRFALRFNDSPSHDKRLSSRHALGPARSRTSPIRMNVQPDRVGAADTSYINTHSKLRDRVRQSLACRSEHSL